MKRFILICFTALSITSCSKDDNNDSGIKNQILTGTVEGEPFTFKGGKAFLTGSLIKDVEQVSINLTNFEANCDTDIFDFELEISAWIPREVGVHTGINIVTQDGSNIPFNNDKQTVEITSISDTEISGKMKLNKSGSDLFEESIFEGTFTIPLCLQDN